MLTGFSKVATPAAPFMAPALAPPVSVETVTFATNVTLSGSGPPPSGSPPSTPPSVGGNTQLGAPPVPDTPPVAEPPVPATPPVPPPVPPVAPPVPVDPPVPAAEIG